MNMKCKNSFMILTWTTMFSLLIISTPSLSSTDGPGSTGASYLTLPVSPKSIAMGETWVSLSNPFALFYNPALLGSDEKSSIGISHSEWIVDTRYDNISVCKPFHGKYAVGFGLTYLYRPEIQGYDQFGIETEKLASSNYQALIGLRFSPTSSLSAGLNLKYFRENLAEWYADGMAFDLGLLYSIEQWGFSGGFAVSNIGPDIKFESIDEPIPMTIRIGGSQSINIDELKMNVTLAGDAVMPKNEDIYMNAGLEIETYGILCLRAGYCGQKQRDGSGFSAGGGIRITEYLSFDYAYSPYGDIGNFHRISLAFSR